MLHPKPRARWPRVTVIIPTKDAPRHLARCLESIFARSTYPNFGVLLVDNGTTDPRRCDSSSGTRWTCCRFDEPFNFSRVNNLGVEPGGRRARRVPQQRHRGADARVARGDGEPRGADGVGAVGPLLLYPNGTVQHAGVVLGMRGTADHVMRGFPGDADGYAGSLSCTREVSAVTAACMLVHRELFAELGGFDEHFATHYQDVDLCLRIRRSGPAHPLHAARRARPPRERDARQRVRPRRPCAAPRRLGRDDRPRRPVLQPVLSLSGADYRPAARRERRLRQLPRLHEQQRDPHLQPRERAHRPRRRLRRVVPGDPATVAPIGTPRFRRSTSATRGAAGFGSRTAGRRHSSTRGRRGRSCASSPRSSGARYGCPYVVHLEDNEDVITADSLGLTLEQLRAMPDERSSTRRSTRRSSHPVRMRRFLAGAAGITVIIDRLLEFRPDGVPAEIVWPAFEPDLFTAGPADPELRRRLGIADGDSVLVYAGNAHASNAAEMRSLYLAVGRVNRAGRPLRLVRLGRDCVQFARSASCARSRSTSSACRASRAPRSRGTCASRTSSSSPAAPTTSTTTASRRSCRSSWLGRPVVLPAANIGRYLRTATNASLLRARRRARDRDRRSSGCSTTTSCGTSSGRARRAFAERNFSWAASAQKLRASTSTCGASRGGRSTSADRALPRVVRPLRGVRAPRLGYATVRDYCDSVERLPLLATASHDMKDVQRPWVLKAIVGTVSNRGAAARDRRGRADRRRSARRLGYDVTRRRPV